MPACWAGTGACPIGAKTNQIGLKFKMRNCVENIGCNSQSVQPLAQPCSLLAAFTRRITQIASRAWQGGDPTCQGQGSTNGLAQEIAHMPVQRHRLTGWRVSLNQLAKSVVARSWDQPSSNKPPSNLPIK